jgi:hypothetical protein
VNRPIDVMQMKRTLKLSCLILGLLATPVAAPAQTVSSVCHEPPLVGIWSNELATTYELSRLEITHFCNGDGPYGRWQVRAHMKCAPRDCIWGRTGAERDKDGKLIAMFRTYNADRFIRMTVSGDRLQAFVLMAPRDPAKRRKTEEITLFREN